MTYTFRFEDQIYIINLGEEDIQTNVEINGYKPMSKSTVKKFL